MIMAAVFLALATVAVALVRRGRLGRRLVALRDSEAAFAMLGGSLLRDKVVVFAFSAGIAGLGGALYAMQQQSIIAAQFAFQAGLPIFLIAVVGGLSSVGTGLFTGTALIGPINAIIEVAPKLLNFTGLLPALAGIGLGRSPSGVIALLRAQWGVDRGDTPFAPPGEYCPPEWLGLRRAWAAEDEEALDRVIARG
jgi:branched-chain amino acid transport system permease protein